MPKHVERDRVRRVHGAFGTGRAPGKRDPGGATLWNFLSGVGEYKNALRVIVDEEYGYRTWLWTYFGTIEEMVRDWKAGRRPINYWGPMKPGLYDGEIDPIYWQKSSRDGVRRPHLIGEDEPIYGITSYRASEPGGPDGNAHVHEHDDSYLKIGYYELNGLDPVAETILVLDALAAI